MTTRPIVPPAGFSQAPPKTAVAAAVVFGELTHLAAACHLKNLAILRIVRIAAAATYFRITLAAL